MATFPCFKCNGSGQVSFKHIANGVCFTCAGSGQLSYRPRAKIRADAHPELLVAEQDRSTAAQWEYLGKLCGDSDRACCSVLKAAGAPMATQRYVTKAVMSRAIEIAKAA